MATYYTISIGLLCFVLTSCAATEMDHSIGRNNDIQRPNIIFILADDLSYKDCSFMGQTHFETPHIDRLAYSGLVFNNAYAGSSECAPSRASLLTGMHMGHCRIRANRSARGQDHLTQQDTTVAEVLKRTGYTCGMVGKWGVGLPNTPGVPNRQGFDYSYGFYDQRRAHSFFPHYMMENDQVIWLPENYGFNMPRLYDYAHSPIDKLDDVANRYDTNGKFIADFIEGSPGKHNPEQVSYTEYLVLSKALSFIASNKSRPFFLYYATQLPHGPTVIPDLGEYKDKPSPWSLKHKEWTAMVSRLDQSVGAIVTELEKNGIRDNTVIFFASDNGYSAWGYFARPRYEDDPLFKNKGPWDGGKFMCRDGGGRVPFFANWPGRIKPGHTDHICALYDFLETAAELASVKPEQPTDGISLVPLLLGRENQQRRHRYLYWENGTLSPDAQAVRMDRWYAYREHPDKPVQLYDLENDLGCTTDVAADHSAIVQQALRYFTEAHVDSEWYNNPGESSETKQAKRRKAEREGTIFDSPRPNTRYPE